MLAHCVSPPTGGSSTARSMEIAGGSTANVTVGVPVVGPSSEVRVELEDELLSFR